MTDFASSKKVFTFLNDRFLFVTNAINFIRNCSKTDKRAFNIKVMFVIMQSAFSILGIS